jgi:two-component system response regulator YesN
MSQAEAYVLQAERYMIENLETIKQIRDVATSLDIHADYLRHIFKEHKMVSIGEWLTLRRLEQARNMLRNTGLPIKSIARKCGFSDSNYFSRRFSQTIGCPPASYRGQLRAEHEQLQSTQVLQA